VTPRFDDEHESAIRARLKSYYDTTQPLKAYYGQKGILREVDGTQSPDDVFSSIVAAL
jgi:adenylate kinase